MTDFRALCAELIQLDQEQPTEYTDWKKRWNAAVGRVRAELAQPEPEGPTDDELEATARAAEIQYSKEHGGLAATTPDGIHTQLQAQRLAGLRAVAARWGK
jgi:hypothetical protein